MKRVVLDLVREYPASPEAAGAELTALDEAQFADTKTPLLLLTLAVASLLLIACINIASLLLASGMSRAHELSVRVALGAARHRLVKELMFVTGRDLPSPWDHWNFTSVIVNEAFARRADRRIPCFYAMTLATFAGFSVLLASVAVFAMMAGRVNERRRECAVRIAYGAPSRAIVWMVVRRVIPLFALGCALGVFAANVLVGSLRHLLVDLTPGDASTIGAVLSLLLMATALAAYLPTRRALSVDPAVTLRAEQKYLLRVFVSPRLRVSVSP